MKMFKIIKREYLERVRRKSFLIGTILGPILMAAMIFAPALIMRFSPAKQASIAVIDQTGKLYNGLEEALTDTLDSGEPMFRLREVKVPPGGLDEAKKTLNIEIESGALDAYIILPEDIVESNKASFYGKKLGDLRTIERIKNEINNSVISDRLAKEGLDAKIVRDMVKNVKFDTIMLKEGGKEREGSMDLMFMSTFIFVMLLYMTILMWGIAVERSIIEEKNNRVIEVMLSSVRPIDLLFGKIFGVGAVGLTQYAIWAVVSVIMVLYGLSMGGPVAEVVSSFSLGTLVYFIIYYLLGFLFYSCLFAGIGSVCNSDQEAQQMQSPIVLCLVFTILVPMMVIQNPDSTFATVISLIPVFTPIVMFMRITVLMPPLWQIALSIIIMIGAIYLAGFFSAKIFRVGILMYGKRPDAREILKWLRKA